MIAQRVFALFSQQKAGFPPRHIVNPPLSLYTEDRNLSIELALCYDLITGRDSFPLTIIRSKINIFYSFSSTYPKTYLLIGMS